MTVTLKLDPTQARTLRNAIQTVQFLYAADYVAKSDRDDVDHEVLRLRMKRLRDVREALSEA